MCRLKSCGSGDSVSKLLFSNSGCQSLVLGLDLKHSSPDLSLGHDARES